MAGLQINPTDIAKARESGYSDQEIADFLSTRAPEQFKTAREAGYSDKEILSHLTGENDKPSGVISGVQKGAADVLHGVAETGKQFLGMDTSGLEGRSQSLTPKDYKGTDIVPEGGHWYDPRTYNYSHIPQAIAEAAPGMAVDIAAARVGARVHPLVGLGAGLASYLARTRGDAAKNDAAVRTGNPDAEPETQDKLRSLATGAVESIPAAVGLNRFLPGGKLPKSAGQALSKALITSGVEGGAGATQNVVSQAGSTVGTDKGLTVDPSQVVEAGITSGATGGMLATPKGLAEAKSARRYGKYYGENEEATKGFVSRVNAALDGDGINTKNSFEAMRTVDEGVRDELKAAVKPLKATLDEDTASALKRAAKGRTLTDSDLANIEKNTTPDVATLARQAHVASLIKQEGDYGQGQFVGGMANAVGKHIRAIQNPAGAAASAALGAAGLGGHAASLFAYGPATLAAIAGGYAGMRGIDALTGNRTPLKGIVDRFSDPAAQVRTPAPPAAPVTTPGSGPTGPSVPFNPGVAGGGTALALGQSPWTAAPQAPAPKAMTPAEMNEQVKSALLMAAARRKTEAARQPTPVDPAALNEQVKSALLMAGARRRVQGNAAAEDLASESPIINDNGGLATLNNPAFGKRANELLSAARAHAALTRQPEEEGQGGPAPRGPGPAPQAPSPIPTIPTAPPTAPASPRPDAPVDPLVLAAKAVAKISKKPEPASQPAPQAPQVTVKRAPYGVYMDHDGWSIVNEDTREKVATGFSSSDKAHDARRKLQADAAQAAAPVDPLVLAAKAAGKISKKKGKVKEEPAPDYTGDYVPLGDHELWGKGLTDDAFAAHEAGQPHVEHKEAYHNNVVYDRQKRRNVLADLTGDAEIEHQEVAAHLLEQLHHIRRGATAAKAIKHYTDKLPPELRDAIRKRMDQSFINSMWSK